MTGSIKGFDYARSTLMTELRRAGIPVSEKIEDVRDAHLAVCHHWDDSEWDAIVRASEATTVRVRTSSVGRGGYPHKVKDGVIVLELRVSHDPAQGGVTAEQWEEIFAKLQEGGVASGIAQGRIPPSLMRYFGPPSSNELQYLPALSILCQGYLAVQAGPEGKPEPEDSKVAEALAKMGWAQVLADPNCRSSLDPCLTNPEDTGGRAALRVEVADPSFWNVFGESDAGQALAPEKLLELARKEWDTVSTKDARFAPVETLIRALDSASVGPAIMVAEAYLELNKRLDCDHAK